MKKVIAFLLTLTILLLPAGCKKSCEHHYSSSITKQATCAKKGEKTFTCTKCGESYTEDIPKTNDHTYSSEVTKKPSVNDTGVRTFTCTLCGDSYTETIEMIPYVVGETIRFGEYEQDNSASDGKESIEWIVIAQEGSQALLVSKYAIDRQPYHIYREDVTWENCSLRKWLNDHFINTAFSAEEQALIVETTVTADKNPKYDTNQGNDTLDKVFLLSCDEMEKYFSSDEVKQRIPARQCVPTDYAIAQGAYVNDDDLSPEGLCTCGWWLRTSGDVGRHVAALQGDGKIFYYGLVVDAGDTCVRPAMWIDMNGIVN